MGPCPPSTCPPPPPTPAPVPTPNPHITTKTSPDCASPDCAHHASAPPCQISGKYCYSGSDKDGLWSLVSEFFGGQDPSRVMLRLSDVEWFITNVLSELQAAADHDFEALASALEKGGVVVAIFTFTPCAIYCAAAGATGILSAIGIAQAESDFNAEIAHVRRELEAAQNANWGTDPHNVYFTLDDNFGNYTSKNWSDQWLSVDTNIVS